MSMIEKDGWLTLLATGDTDYYQYVLGSKIESVRLEREEGKDTYTLKVYANSKEYIYNDGLIESFALEMVNELKEEVANLAKNV